MAKDMNFVLQLDDSFNYATVHTTPNLPTPDLEGRGPNFSLGTSSPEIYSGAGSPRDVARLAVGFLPHYSANQDVGICPVGRSHALQTLFLRLLAGLMMMVNLRRGHDILMLLRLALLVMFAGVCAQNEGRKGFCLF
jgi:hypothetical protein